MKHGYGAGALAGLESISSKALWSLMGPLGRGGLRLPCCPLLQGGWRLLCALN